MLIQIWLTNCFQNKINEKLGGKIFLLNFENPLYLFKVKIAKEKVVLEKICLSK
jgi:hypothetical protein